MENPSAIVIVFHFRSRAGIPDGLMADIFPDCTERQAYDTVMGNPQDVLVPEIPKSEEVRKLLADIRVNGGDNEIAEFLQNVIQQAYVLGFARCQEGLNDDYDDE